MQEEKHLFIKNLISYSELNGCLAFPFHSAFWQMSDVHCIFWTESSSGVLDNICLLTNIPEIDLQ